MRKKIKNILSIKSNRIAKNFFLLSTVSLFGCYTGGYGDRMPIAGDIDITLNDKGDLCFKPLFNTTKLGGGSQKPMQINYLRMEQLTIFNSETVGDYYDKVTITPANNKYFNVYNGQKVCLNNNNSELKQETFSSFRNKEELVVHIAGFNDDEKDVYSTLFYKEFKYPYTPK